jgi:mannose-6-phosphate isomerase-like protein (cupin superfamily)
VSSDQELVVSNLVVHRDAVLSRTQTTKAGGTRYFDDVWVDEEHQVTVVFSDADGSSIGSRGFTELLVIVEGEGSYEIEDKKIRFGPGDLIVWPADMAAVFTPDDRVRLFCIAYPFIRTDAAS